MNIEQAKQIPLEDMLRRLGHMPRRQARGQLWYRSPFRDETTPSFKVNQSANLWYDFGEGRGGDIIDLVQRVERLGSVSDTLGRMDELVGSVAPPPLPASKAGSRDVGAALELVSVGPVKARSLMAYLKKRGIDPRAVQEHAKEVHYRRRGKEYFALGLENTSGGYELRNPFFKGTLGGKDISVIPGRPDHVAVFEGMFDYLTALELAGGRLEETAVVLNSVALRDRAIEHIRALSPSRVDLYGDHDAAGEQLAAHFQKALPETKIVDKSVEYLGHRDLNEWHAAGCPSR